MGDRTDIIRTKRRETPFDTGKVMTEKQLNSLPGLEYIRQDYDEYIFKWDTPETLKYYMNRIKCGDGNPILPKLVLNINTIQELLSEQRQEKINQILNGV